MASASVINLKIVVTGPFAAGKTTFISTVSEIPVVTTEAGATQGSDVKDDTTVTMDFGKISVDDGQGVIELYLFGTPGQARFDFMWQILARGMLGYILLVDGTRPETWGEALVIKRSFEEIGNSMRVVAVNRGGDQATLAAVARELELDPDDVIVPTDAADLEAVKQTLLTLLIEILEVVEARDAGRHAR